MKLECRTKKSKEKEAKIKKKVGMEEMKGWRKKEISRLVNQ